MECKDTFYVLNKALYDSMIYLTVKEDMNLNYVGMNVVEAVVESALQSAVPGVNQAVKGHAQAIICFPASIST